MSVDIQSIVAIQSLDLVALEAGRIPSRFDLPFEPPAQQAVAPKPRPAIPGRSRWLGYAKRYGAIAVFLAAWEIAPRLDLVERSLVPPLSLVVVAWWKMLLTGELIGHVAASLARSLVGLALASLVALPLGMAIGWSKNLSDSVGLPLELLRNTAALALLPLFILFLGIGEASKIALVTFSCSWPILLNSISGVRNVDPLLIKMSRTLGFGGTTLFRKVVLPASLPSIFVGLRLSAAISLLALIAAEMVGAKAGLGYLIQYAQYSFLIPKMYAGILTISGLGLALNVVFTNIERRLTRWNPATIPL
jgi:NitT/TauT family transport system permease protein